ncbi:MAG: hypothetical protein ACR2G3_09995, partial [Solirubrobacterales bacterium]
GLRFCDLVEAVVIDPVRHKGDIIPQTSDVTNLTLSGAPGVNAVRCLNKQQTLYPFYTHRT